MCVYVGIVLIAVTSVFDDNYFRLGSKGLVDQSIHCTHSLCIELIIKQPPPVFMELHKYIRRDCSEYMDSRLRGISMGVASVFCTRPLWALVSVY